MSKYIFLAMLFVACGAQEGTTSEKKVAKEDSKNQEKVAKGLKCEYRAESQTTPSTLLGWLGYGAEASCMTFKQLRNVNADGTVDAGIPLRCLTESSVAEHAANQTRPSLPAYFNASVRTGGGFCISMVGIDIAKAES